MCTVARLVQGAAVSSWFGMPMQDSHNPAANVRLRSGEPAYLEVVINPAAHGEAGLGPIGRGVLLETESGQRLLFDLRALVVR